MTIKCFSHPINLDSALIQEYETKVAPFNSDRAEYLAITSGVDKNSSKDDIADALIDGLLSEIELYSHKNEIVIQAHEKGII